MIIFPLIILYLNLPSTVSALIHAWAFIKIITIHRGTWAFLKGFFFFFFFLQIQLGGEYEQSVFYHVHRDNTMHIYFILCQSKACTESADFIHGKVDVGRKKKYKLHLLSLIILNQKNQMSKLPFFWSSRLLILPL